MINVLLALLLATTLTSKQDAPKAVTWGAWQAIGPIDVASEGKSLKKTLWPEKELSRMETGGPGPRLDRSGPLTEGHKGSWNELHANLIQEGGLDVGLIDLRRHLTPPEGSAGWSANVATYLYRSIDATEESLLPVFLGAQKSARVWLNGELLIDFQAGWYFRAMERAAKLKLRSGRNHLFVRLTSDRSGELLFRMQAFAPPSSDAVRHAIARSARYLLQDQLLDGSWHGDGQPGDTALVMEALLAAGLASDHPAILAGKEYLAATPGNWWDQCALLSTYARCQDPELAPLMQVQLDAAIEQLTTSGRWPSNDPVRMASLCLTLLDAKRAGLDLLSEELAKLKKNALRMPMGKPEGKRVKGQARPTGYRAGRHGDVSAGSTVAGLLILGIIEDLLGPDFSKHERTSFAEQRDAALAWVEERAPLSFSGKFYGRWHGKLGYMLQLQQGYALLGIQELRGLDLATRINGLLLDEQAADGSWALRYRHVETTDSPVAMLLLSRVNKVIPALLADLDSLPARAPARLAVSIGGGRAWIEATEMGSQQTASPRRISGIRLLARPAHSDLDFEPVGGWEDIELAIGDCYGKPMELALSGSGLWEIRAKITWAAGASAPESSPGVSAIDANAAPDTDADSETNQHSPDCGSVLVWMTTSRATGEGPVSSLNGDNLLRGIAVECEATSASYYGDARSAADNTLGTSWIAEVGDATPALTVELKHATPANQIWLTHAHPSAWPRLIPRAAQIKVIINGRQEFMVRMPEDGWSRGHCSFGRDLRVKKIELLPMNWKTGGRFGPGLSEVELVRR